MKILGIGVDIVENKRLKKSIRNKRTRDGAEEARVAHNHEVAGSKPASAKKFFN